MVTSLIPSHCPSESNGLVRVLGVVLEDGNPMPRVERAMHAVRLVGGRLETDIRLRSRLQHLIKPATTDIKNQNRTV